MLSDFLEPLRVNIVQNSNGAPTEVARVKTM